MLAESLTYLIGQRIQVFDAQRSEVRAEGKLIGIIDAPVLVIELDDGTRACEPSTLPRNLMVWPVRPTPT